MRLIILGIALLLLPVAASSAAGTAPDVVFTLAAGDVIVASADGSNQHDLTGTALTSERPVWSPNGTTLAFAGSTAATPRHIWVVGADGSGLHDLTPDLQGFATSPTWSPDGSEIAYLLRGGEWNHAGDVWVVSLAGGPPRRLTTDGGEKNGVWWSPRGDTLAFDDDVGAGLDVTVIDAVSGAFRWSAFGQFSSPMLSPWSPDGRELAFVRADAPAARIAVIGSDGRGERTLANGILPEWSPDGKTIVYDQTRFVDGYPQSTDIWSVPADGSGTARQLTGPSDSGTAWNSPSFSPDGSQIEMTGRSGVWRMNADGTCQHPLELFAGAATPPVWRPGASVGGAVRCANVRLSASVPAMLPVGSTTTLQVGIDNNGNLPATEVRLHPSLVAGTGRVACESGCEIGELAPGATADELITVLPTNPGILTLSFRATLDQPDIDAKDNTVALSTDVTPCTILGTAAANRLVGTPGADHICGLPGPDLIFGGAGNDYLDAGSGNDTIFGGPGHDTILGKGGRDTIFARDGQRDYIDCGTEFDVAVVDELDHVRNCERVLRK